MVVTQANALTVGRHRPNKGRGPGLVGRARRSYRSISLSILGRGHPACCLYQQSGCWLLVCCLFLVLSRRHHRANPAGHRGEGAAINYRNACINSAIARAVVAVEPHRCASSRKRSTTLLSRSSHVVVLPGSASLDRQTARLFALLVQFPNTQTGGTVTQTMMRSAAARPNAIFKRTPTIPVNGARSYQKATNFGWWNDAPLADRLVACACRHRPPCRATMRLSARVRPPDGQMVGESLSSCMPSQLSSCSFL